MKKTIVTMSLGLMLFTSVSFNVAQHADTKSFKKLSDNVLKTQRAHIDKLEENNQSLEQLLTMEKKTKETLYKIVDTQDKIIKVQKQEIEKLKK